jgi:hypothetical protein
MELPGTMPARDLLAGAWIRAGDGYACTVVNREINGNVIVRGVMDGARATLRPVGNQQKWDTFVKERSSGCGSIVGLPALPVVAFAPL